MTFYLHVPGLASYPVTYYFSFDLGGRGLGVAHDKSSYYC
jgi:hypothetical protein